MKHLPQSVFYCTNIPFLNMTILIRDHILYWIYNYLCNQWFCQVVSSTNKTDCHDIAEILLKVALITIT